jgi:hypothetical protein
MSKKTVTYILILLVIGTIIFSTVFNNGKCDEIKTDGIELIGTIQIVGSDQYAKWQVNNEDKRKRISIPNSYIVSGEQFKIYYLDKYPDICYIDFAHPVYDQSVFEQTSCLTLKQINDSKVNFTYMIEDKKYERFLDLNFRGTKASELMVFYNPSNRKIAYLERK